jgi:glutathione S-transferase
MQIYWFKAQAPLRVLALAKHLGIAAETIEVDMMSGGLRTPGYLALNPNAKAPTLVDGGRVVWESAAIMAHLCAHVGSDMWPQHDVAEQVELLRWLSWSDAHWSAAVAPWYFERIVKPTFGIGEPDESALVNAPEALHRYAPALEAQLGRQRFVALPRLTIADFHAASMARYWKETGMPLADYPNIQRWLDDLLRIPAWADPWPESRYARF